MTVNEAVTLFKERINAYGVGEEVKSRIRIEIKDEYSFKVYVNGIWFITISKWDNTREALSAYAYCSLRLATTNEFRAK